jgi:PAS domain S-box-containing protein
MNRIAEAETLLAQATEAASRLSGDRLQEILDAIPAALYTTDEAGRLTHFNRAAVEFAGRVPELGTDRWCVSWKLYDLEGNPLAHEQCPMAVSLREGRPVRGVEAYAERPDGKRIAFLPFPTPLRDAAGRVVGGVNMLLDITERKRMENALRESEARWRSLIGLLPAAVYTCEAPEGRITFFNTKAAELWGREPRLDDTEERFCGSYRLWLPDGAPLAHADTPMALALREGRTFRNHDVVIERPDGSRLSALVNIDPIRDAQGAVVGAINVFVDTTALKRAEAELRDADRRKDEFLATLSHELRNPLAAIRSATDVLQRLGAQANVRDQACGILERQAAQMTRLVSELLDLTRISRGTITPEKELVELSAILSRAVETSLPRILEAGHRLEMPPPGEPVHLFVDPMRIEQVVTNLLDNAAKYTPPGGKIRLAVRVQPDEVALTVADNGVGIGGEMLPRVFDMFARATPSGLQGKSGLGIGLSIARAIARMHEGDIEARSLGAGYGSEFTLRLPRQLPD